MNDTPLVSVVIPAYNVGRFVRESVDSALNQTHPRMDVIVVNDGSTDDTGEILRSYGDRIVTITQQNQGLSAARNAGLRAVRGELVAFLDSDDAWLPEKTVEQLELFKRSPRIGLVSCPYFLMDEKSEIFDEVNKGQGLGGDRLEDLLLKNTVGSPSGVIVRRDCLERVGTFDENLINGSEDWDFYLRVVRASYNIAFASRPLMKYRVLSSSMSSAKNADRMLRNDLIVLRKAFSDPRLNRDWLIKGKAYSSRYLSAAWHYIDAGDERLPALRRAVVRSFLCYPPAFLDRPHLMVVLHSLLGQKRFDGLKKKMRRLRA